MHHENQRLQYEVMKPLFKHCENVSFSSAIYRDVLEKANPFTTLELPQMLSRQPFILGFVEANGKPSPQIAALRCN